MNGLMIDGPGFFSQLGAVSSAEHLRLSDGAALSALKDVNTLPRMIKCKYLEEMNGTLTFSCGFQLKAPNDIKENVTAV